MHKYKTARNKFSYYAKILIVIALTLLIYGLLLNLDVKTFVDAICGLLDNPQQIKTFGDNSRILYESEFNIRNRIAMLEDIYKEVANR